MSGKENAKINVAEVAELARLALAPDQLASLQKEMESIVGYVEMLAELDVSGIEPTAHAADRVNVMRNDEPGEPRSREDMLADAPDTIDGELLRVPQMLPGEGEA